ncbi:GIY-YIG nuclease family protein [Petroclostridium sp. X23]|uniref:GIY-YIG nuclease family protein n=1 Tax=Petroclostridium sp. X23 TaxID=3045146 RepID=UPI0024ADBF44|nr:GIY-YIG nuclease family protein [Petroclostridium sp. X23]WHH61087.1 GIY-YIG nuclease family protein [Petroclostridium sp. X23]
MNYVYIIECIDKTLYTGWTTDIHRRISEHNQGKGAKYTRSRYPVKLVYFEEYTTKQEATKREYEIKQLSRKEKLKLFSKLGNLPIK